VHVLEQRRPTVLVIEGTAAAPLLGACFFVPLELCYVLKELCAVAWACRRGHQWPALGSTSKSVASDTFGHIVCDAGAASLADEVIEDGITGGEHAEWRVNTAVAICIFVGDDCIVHVVDVSKVRCDTSQYRATSCADSPVVVGIA
jgi:hypothetical protein